ncbi:MAG: hypothetical protein ACTJLM_00165 [Ehrlichia sp.]
MNLIFLFSEDSVPVLLPANACQFDKEKGVYVTQDERRNMKLADASCLDKIDSNIRGNMYGTEFKDYCIIDVDHRDTRLRLCFLICNDGKGENKFVVFSLDGVSLCSIRDNGVELTRNILIGCGVSKQGGFHVSQESEGTSKLVSYVMKRNLLKREIYGLLVFIYPKNLPMGHYERVVEDTGRGNYGSLPVIQKNVAMLFSHIFDTQLLGPLVDTMNDEKYILNFFDPRGELFYTRAVDKYNVSRTIVVNSVDIVNCLGR